MEHNVFMQKKVRKYQSSFRSIPIKIFKTVVTANKCIKVICALSYKVALFKVIQIYNGAKTP
jgi:hypothetical protein